VISEFKGEERSSETGPFRLLCRAAHTQAVGLHTSSALDSRCDSTVSTERGATPSAAFMTLSGRMAFANPPLVFSHAIRFSTGEGAEPRSEIIVQPVIAVCEEEGVEGHVGGGEV